MNIVFPRQWLEWNNIYESLDQLNVGFVSPMKLSLYMLVLMSLFSYIRFEIDVCSLHGLCVLYSRDPLNPYQKLYIGWVFVIALFPWSNDTRDISSSLKI